MQERFKQLFGDERGVSPVIGVILMVAITVILAAVIGFFVLGLGSDQASAPQASFSYNSADDVLTMESGETIDPDTLSITVDGGAATNGFATGTDVTAGVSSGKIGASSGDPVKVIWNSPDTDQSSTIWQTTV